MEAAWKEVENGEAGAGAGAGVGDPDLQAVWDDQDDATGVETLEGVWGRTAARLEAGEGINVTHTTRSIHGSYLQTYLLRSTYIYIHTCIHT